MAAPLLYRDTPIGVLQIRSRHTGLYSQRHLDLLERVSSQIAGAVTNARLYAEREKSEEALRDSEERFRQIAENMREVVFLVDHQDYKILYINPAMEEIWGRPREVFYQQPTAWIEAIHPDDLGRINEAFQRQQTTGEFTEEFRIVRPDGSIRWIHDSVVPIRDGLGKTFRLVGIAEDITERKQAEEALQSATVRLQEQAQKLTLTNAELDKAS